jgi:hypothetical protein
LAAVKTKVDECTAAKNVRNNSKGGKAKAEDRSRRRRGQS